MHTNENMLHTSYTTQAHFMLEFLPTAFAVILMPMALPILLKVEFNFKVMMYITIFVFHIQKPA